MQASRAWDKHLVARLKFVGLEQNLADRCVLVEERSVFVVTRVHVDGTFSLGRKEGFDTFVSTWTNLSPLLTTTTTKAAGEGLTCLRFWFRAFLLWFGVTRAVCPIRRNAYFPLSTEPLVRANGKNPVLKMCL